MRALASIQLLNLEKVAVLFYQSIRSSAQFAALQNQVHGIHFNGGYQHLLQLRFLENSVQHFTEIVDQSVHGRIGGMNLVYRELLFAQIRHVAFFEQSLKLTDAHAIQHSELGHALTILTLQVLPHLFLILRTQLCCVGWGGGSLYDRTTS